MSSHTNAWRQRLRPQVGLLLLGALTAFATTGPAACAAGGDRVMSLTITSTAFAPEGAIPTLEHVPALRDDDDDGKAAGCIGAPEERRAQN